MKKNIKIQFEEANLRPNLIKLTLLSLSIILMLNLFINIYNVDYYYLAVSLIVSSLIISIANLSIGWHTKFVKVANYIWLTILMNILSFSFYLFLVELLNPSFMWVKIILPLNYILLEMLLIYKRIIIKNESYIKDLLAGKHGKYFKQDMIFVVVISALIILFAKIFDNGHIYVGRIGGMVSEIFGTPLITVAIVAHVHIFANYIFKIKQKN